MKTEEQIERTLVDLMEALIDDNVYTLPGEGNFDGVELDVSELRTAIKVLRWVLDWNREEHV